MILILSAVLVVYMIVETIVELVLIWNAFIPFIFLTSFSMIKTMSSVMWYIYKNKEVDPTCTIYYTVNLLIQILSIVGWNNSEEWFFTSSERRYEKLEFWLWVGQVSLSTVLFFICVLPSFTVQRKVFADGRRFQPSTSTSAIARFWHNFKFMWSFTWPQVTG